MGACVVAGCGKSTGGGGSVARADLAPQAAQAFCESFAGCCQQQNVPVDVQACSGKLSADFEESFKELDVKTSYDAAAAGACLAAIRDTVRCGEPDDDALEATCNKIFVGHVKPGGACTQREECEPSAAGRTYCNFDGSSDQGVCAVEQTAPAPHAKLGDACLTTCEGNECDSVGVPAPGGNNPQPTGFCYLEDGLFCRVDTCAERLALGAACTGGDICVPGAFCAFETHTCEAPRADGAACQGDDDCFNGSCEDGVCGPHHPSVEHCQSGSPL